MSKLDDFPIEVSGADDDDAAPNARALLVELETLLTRLVVEGKEGSIDLRSLPLGSTDLAFLHQILGAGEVEAEVHALGPTQVSETGIQGIWWVSHYNQDHEVMAEFLEVTLFPDILRAHIADVEDSLELLRARLVTGSGH